MDAEKDGEPEIDIMGMKELRVREGLPKGGELKRLLVIRLAFFTDGECLAEKLKLQGKSKAYRVSKIELGRWMVSRKAMAHYVINAIVHWWDEFENKCEHHILAANVLSSRSSHNTDLCMSALPFRSSTVSHLDRNLRWIKKPPRRVVKSYHCQLHPHSSDMFAIFEVM